MASCSLSKDRSDRVNAKVFVDLTDYSSSPSYFLPEDPLPTRSGDRPECETCLPHAQMTQQSPDAVFEELKQKSLDLLGNSVQIGHSTVSMPSTYPAFHLICQDCNTTSIKMPVESCMTPGGPTCGTEFAHVHAQYHAADSEWAHCNSEKRWQSWQGGGQGSMHLCLTLQDAALVLEKGWGERHVLAGGDGAKVPRGLVLVYAPRTHDEIAVSLQILKAAWWFAQDKQ
jgi:hypothetical protein